MILLLDLPEPLHGMSGVNSSVLTAVNAVNNANENTSVINTVPSYAASLFGSKYWGGVKLIHTIFCYARLVFTLACSKRCIVYRPINGGFGQVYDLFYLTICRVFGARIVIHHHSFNYINHKSRLFYCLELIAGKEAKHVVLGPKMGALLNSMYGVSSEQVIVVSNVAFFDIKNCSDAMKRVSNPLVVGHLANLCLEKGVDDFIVLCKELNALGVNYTAKIAGPFSNKESERLVKSACSVLDEVEYIGGLYGEDKEEFFQSLDVFVFPSRYKNEAEPLVLYEAGQYGVLNIGTRRGCMQDVIKVLQGVSFEETAYVAQSMACEIQHQELSGGFSASSRINRVKAFENANLKAEASLKNLLIAMEVGDVSRPQ